MITQENRSVFAEMHKFLSGIESLEPLLASNVEPINLGERITAAHLRTLALAIEKYLCEEKKNADGPLLQVLDEINKSKISRILAMAFLTKKGKNFSYGTIANRKSDKPIVRGDLLTVMAVLGGITGVLERELESGQDSKGKERIDPEYFPPLNCDKYLESF